MSKERRYRLLKDLPITLAGTIFYPKENNSSVYKPKNGGWLEEVPEEIITGCPEWFSEIVEQPVKEREQVLTLYKHSENAFESWYMFASRYVISVEKYGAIIKAIESVLNNDTVEDVTFWDKMGKFSDDLIKSVQQAKEQDNAKVLLDEIKNCIMSVCDGTYSENIEDWEFVLSSRNTPATLYERIIKAINKNQ